MTPRSWKTIALGLAALLAGCATQGPVTQPSVLPIEEGFVDNGGAAKTWVTDRYGLRVLRGTGWLANLHLLWVVVDVRQVQRARQ